MGELYIQGHGVQDPSVPPMDPEKNIFVYVPTTNQQMFNDTASACNALLVQEYLQDTAYIQKLASHCLDMANDRNLALDYALHVGCGVGKVSALLASRFNKVLAVDASARCIDACFELQQGNFVHFTYLGETYKATLPFIPTGHELEYKQLTWLPQEVEPANFILITNLERYENPTAWLARMKELLLPDGILAIVASTSLNFKGLLRKIPKFRLVHEEDMSEFAKGGSIMYWVQV